MPIIDEWVISALSACFAGGAVIYSIQSNAIAKRALAIAEAERSAKAGSVTAYLSDAFRMPHAPEHRAIAVFSILFTNRSELDDAIVQVELEVRYVTSGGIASNIRIPSGVERQSIDLPGVIRQTAMPIILGPRAAQNAHCAFELPKVLDTATRILEYRVEANCASAHVTTVEVQILREVAREKP